MSQLDTGVRSPSLINRFSGYAFLALITSEVALLWVFAYFPSQDGPSHLHNASVLANYNREFIYREYYRLTPFQPAGNMLTQFMLAGLLKFTGLLLAEKLLLTCYVILLPFSFRYLLRALTPHADSFSFFAFILVPNYFLYMGFWNFCYSICFLLLTVGFYFRHIRCWTLRSIIVLGIGGLGVYMTHAVSWVICLIAVASWGLVQLTSGIWGQRGCSSWAVLRMRLKQYGLPLCVLLLPAVFMLAHLMRSPHSVCGTGISWRARLHPLYSLGFLKGIAAWDLMLAKAVAATLILMLLFVVASAVWRQQYEWCSTGLLVASLTCAVVAVLSPDCIGHLILIRIRVGLYACLFFVLWMSMQKWPRVSLHATSIVFCAIAVSSMVARYPVHRRLSQELSEFVAVGQRICPRKSVLLVELEVHSQGAGKIWPYNHAAGLLSERTIIDLGNYEPSTDYFSTSFRPERSPFPALGTAEQLQTVPPIFDIGRYERQTRGRVDYILVFGNTGSLGDESEMGEIKLYGNQMAVYQLVSSGHSGNLRLYQRSSPYSGDGESCNSL